mgnify:CR=1 FL=1
MKKMKSAGKGRYGPEAHTFAVCAYGESPYLEECICSLLDQNLKKPYYYRYLHAECAYCLYSRKVQSFYVC